MAENYDIRVAFDASGAERGLKTYGSSVASMTNKLLRMDRAGAQSFGTLTKAANKISFARVTKSADSLTSSVRALNKELSAAEKNFGAIGRRSETAFAQMGGAAKRLDFKAVTKQTHDLQVGLVGLEATARKSADAMQALARAKSAISKGKVILPKSLTDGSQAGGIIKITNALTKMGAVRINPALATNLAKTGAAMAGLRTPSKAFIDRLPVLFNTLAKAHVPSNLGAALGAISVSTGAFKAPSGRAIANFERLIAVLSTANASQIQATVKALMGLNGLTITAPPNLGQLIAGLNRLQGQANRTRGSLGGVFNQFTPQIRTAITHLRGLQNQMSLTYQASTLLRTAMGSLTVGALVRDIYDAGKASERFALTLGAVATSAQEMAQHTAFLEKFTSEVPVRLRDVQVGYSKFATSARIAGMSVQDTQHIFSSFSKALVVMGASADDQRLAFMALEQMMSKGKITAEELRQQLGERLPGVMAMLAASMGITGEALDAMMQRGEVRTENLIKLATRVNSIFGNQMAAALAKPAAKMQLLMTEWDKFAQTVYNSGFASGLAAMFDELTSAMKSDQVKTLAERLGSAFKELFITVGAVGRVLIENWDKIVTFGTVLAGWMVAKTVASTMVGLAASIFSLGSIVFGTATLMVRGISLLSSGVVQAAGLAVRGISIFGAAALAGNPIALGIAAAGVAIAAGYFLVKPAMESAGKAIREWLGEGTVKSISAAIDALGYFGDLLKWVAEGAMSAIPAMKPTGWFLESMLGDPAAVADAGKDSGSTAAGGFMDGLEGMLSGFSFTEILDVLSNKIGEAVDTLGAKVGDATGFGKMLDDLRVKADELQKAMDKSDPDYAKNMERDLLQAEQNAIALTKAQKELFEDIDPAAKAMKEYTDNFKVLKDMLASGALSQDKFDTLAKALDRTTLEKRNPYAAAIRDLEEEYAILQKSADEREVETKVIAMRNDLISKGVPEAEKLAEAMRGVYEAMEDMEKGGTNGFQRWSEGVKSLRDSLMEVESEALSSLSDALTDFVTDGKMDFESLGKDILRSINKALIDDLMKDFFKDFDLGGGKGPLGWLFGTEGKRGGEAPFDAAKKLAEGIQPITANVANIYAAGVTLNGTPLGAGGIGSDARIPLSSSTAAGDRVAQGWDQFSVGGGGALEDAMRKKFGNAIPAGPMTKEDLPLGTGWNLRPSIGEGSANRVSQGWDTFSQPVASPTLPDVGPMRTSLPGFAPSTATPSMSTAGFDPTAPGSGFTGTKNVSPQLMSDLMRDYGLTKEQAAGVVGNFAHETGGFKHFQELNPTVSGSKGGAGWAQWTGMSKRNPRRANFEAYTAQSGLPADSYAANYGFMQKELGGSHSYALDALKKQDTVDSSMRAFERTYEGAGVKHYGSRLNYAQQAYGMGTEPVASAQTDMTGLGETFKTEMRGSFSEVGTDFSAKMQTPIQQTGTQLKTAMTPQMDQTATTFTTAFSPANEQVSQDYVMKMQNANSQVAQAVNQMESPLGQTATDLQSTATAAQEANPMLGGLRSALGMLPGPLGQVANGLLDLFSSLGNSNGGGGGIFGALGGLFGGGGGGEGMTSIGGLFREGGISGAAVSHTSVSSAAYRSAPHYAEGTPKALRAPGTSKIGGGFPSVLHDNEAVIPLSRGRAVDVQLTGRDKQDNVRRGGTVIMNVYAKDADSFRRSQSQIQSDMANAQNRAAHRQN